MVSNKMEKVLNEQLNAELFSSYLYLSMAAYFEANNWRGFAKWMEKQSNEEYGHAMKFYKFIIEVGKRVSLDKVEKPKLEWSSPLEVFEEALKHEIYITKRINDLVNLAVEEKDHATNNFLQWFVNEQVEEVSTVKQIVENIKHLGDNVGSLFMLNHELGKRQ